MRSEFKKAQDLKSAIETHGISFYLDIDGVIADLNTHLEKNPQFYKNGKVLWNELDHDFYANIPIIDGARDFFFDLKDMADVRFLTSPSLIDSCYSGKANWIAHKFLPEYGQDALRILMIVRSNDKHLLAAPNRILIDDTASNVENWMNAGGIGINHDGDFEETYYKIQEAILSFDTKNDVSLEP